MWQMVILQPLYLSPLLFFKPKRDLREILGGTNTGRMDEETEIGIVAFS